MPEQNKPFVVTDRRRHTMDGEVRPDADPAPEREVHTPTAPLVAPASVGEASTLTETMFSEGPGNHETEGYGPEDAAQPQAPTAEQMAQVRFAYTQTADRLTTALRAVNPGMDHPPPMNFEGLVQSVYMTAIMQLGGATPQGQQPQVDLMGAQQSIEMLSVLTQKTSGNLKPEESALLDRAVFELQAAFLEITQALARSAAAKQQGQPSGQGFGPPPGGRPSIVR